MKKLMCLFSFLRIVNQLEFFQIIWVIQINNFRIIKQSFLHTIQYASCTDE